MEKSDFRVIIAGSRDFSDYPLLCTKCDSILGSRAVSHSIVIVSGQSRGADLLGERYAAERGYRVCRYPADWRGAGRRAGILRNTLMAENADALIAFWDGRSPGTRNMISQARRRRLAVRVIDTHSPQTL